MKAKHLFITLAALAFMGTTALLAKAPDEKKNQPGSSSTPHISSKPAGGGSSGPRPPSGMQMRPSSKPSYTPPSSIRPPSVRPSPVKPPSVSKPGSGTITPQTKPGYKPSKPATPSATRPPSPIVTKPVTKPTTQTGTPPTIKPGTPSVTRPGRPDYKPGRPSIPPSVSRPNQPTIVTKPVTPVPPVIHPGITTKPGNKPKPHPVGSVNGTPLPKPTTKPGVISDGRPVKPLPGVVTIPKPGKPTKPAQYPGVTSRPIPLPTHPAVITRPPTPQRPPQWQHVESSHIEEWNHWQQSNRVTINNIQVNRSAHWSTINNHYHQPGWASHYGSDDYRRWHHHVIDYRRDRCNEIWYHRHPSWNSYFDHHWWGTCWWRPRPPVVHVHVSPWWWWRPFAWVSVGSFFGTSISSQPLIYDPGTTVIYEGDTYYINGQPSGNAVEARQEATRLATPELKEMPVPEPPAEGESEQWLPMGVWALTQVEQGDATMFMQLSVDKNGIVAGAYKNVLTGDEQPIVGQLDKKTQRVAWHVGENTGTVYETGFSGFENDVVSIFVHLGEEQTQNWLLVRLPSPEMPPGSVKLPEPDER